MQRNTSESSSPDHLTLELDVITNSVQIHEEQVELPEASPLINQPSTLRRVRSEPGPQRAELRSYTQRPQLAQVLAPGASFADRWRADVQEGGPADKALEAEMFHLERGGLFAWLKWSRSDWWYFLRTTLDFYPYDEGKLAVRTHVREGFIASVLMSLLALSFMIYSGGVSWQQFHNNEFDVSSKLGRSTWRTKLPFNLEPLNRTTLFGANMKQRGYTVHNESLFRVEFYTRTIYDGDYNRKKPCSVDADCRRVEGSLARCVDAKCRSRTAWKNLGKKRCKLGSSETGYCPVDGVSVQGEYGDPVYTYIQVMGALCKRYCGKPGEIACSQCASDQELDSIIRTGVGTSVSIRDFKSHDVGAWSKYYLTTATSLCMKMEVFFRRTTELWHSRWDFLGGDEKYDYATFEDSYVRSDEMKEMITSFFLRADKFETEIKKTPYTLMDLLQSLGATWSFLGITVGLVARKINGLASSREEMERSVSTYIRAVAWGDLQRAIECGHRLRRGMVRTNEYDELLQKEMFETIHRFRKEMDEMVIFKDREMAGSADDEVAEMEYMKQDSPNLHKAHSTPSGW